MHTICPLFIQAEKSLNFFPANHFDAIKKRDFFIHIFIFLSAANFSVFSNKFSMFSFIFQRFFQFDFILFISRSLAYPVLSEESYGNETNESKWKMFCVGYLFECEYDVPISYILSLARVESKFHTDAHTLKHSSPPSIYTSDGKWMKNLSFITLYLIEARRQMKKREHEHSPQWNDNKLSSWIH